MCKKESRQDFAPPPPSQALQASVTTLHAEFEAGRRCSHINDAAVLIHG